MIEIQAKEVKANLRKLYLPREITKIKGSKVLSRDSTKKKLRLMCYSLEIFLELLLYGLLRTPIALSLHCSICYILS